MSVDRNLIPRGKPLMRDEQRSVIVMTSENLDTLLIFTPKHLCLAPFDQQGQRPMKQIGVHAMEI